MRGSRARGASRDRRRGAPSFGFDPEIATHVADRAGELRPKVPARGEITRAATTPGKGAGDPRRIDAPLEPRRVGRDLDPEVELERDREEPEERIFGAITGDERDDVDLTERIGPIPGED